MNAKDNEIASENKLVSSTLASTERIVLVQTNHAMCWRMKSNVIIDW